jgi:hypothetical protein
MASPFTVWESAGNNQNEYETPTGPYAIDASWLSNDPWNTLSQGPFFAASGAETSANVGPGQSGTYNIVLTARDLVGDVQPLAQTVATTTMINPFPAGRLSGSNVYSQSGNVGSGAIFWWQASSSVPGDYALEAETYTENFADISSTTTPAITLSGKVVTLEDDVASPLSWNLALESSDGTTAAFNIAFTVAASANTLNADVLTVTTDSSSGAISVTSPLLTIPALSGFSDTALADLTPGGSDHFNYTVEGSGFYQTTLNTTTDTFSTPVLRQSETAYSQVFASAFPQTTNAGTNTGLIFVDGIRSGTQYIDVYQASSGPNTSPVTSFALTGAAFGGMSLADVLDPTTGNSDYTAVAYYSNGLIHVELVNSSGQQIGTDFTISGASSLVGIQSFKDTRIVVTYSAPDASGGNYIASEVLDTATAGTTITITTPSGGYGEYAGTPFNDTFIFGPGTNVLNGGGGTDTLNATTLSSSEVNVSVNAQDNIILTDTSGDSDTLENFSTIELADSTIEISGNTLYQYFSNGSETASQFNITGQNFNSDVYYYSSPDDLQSVTYINVTGEPYESYTYYYDGQNTSEAPNLVGSAFYYSNQANGLDAIAYGAGGYLSQVFYSPVNGANWSNLQIDYVSNQLANSAYTFTANGQPYSYYTEYFNSGGQYLQELINFPLSNASFSDETVIVNNTGQVVQANYNGYNGSASGSAALDSVAVYYNSSGSYNGESVEYSVTGQSYKIIDETYNASNQLTGVGYHGFSGTPYSSVLEFFSDGSLQYVAYEYDNITDNNTYKYYVLENASGSYVGAVYDDLNGTQVVEGSGSNFVLPSLGGDPNFAEQGGASYDFGNQEDLTSFAITGGNFIVTGGGGGDTFTFNQYFANATITDYGTYFGSNNPDIVSMPAGDFASWQAMLGSAQNNGSGGTMFTAPSGDKLTLDGVSVQQLQALTTTQASHLFTFHS